MDYILSALGQDLSWPGLISVHGVVEDAIHEAEAILRQDPACEAVEIFSEGRFVADVPRLKN